MKAFRNTIPPAGRYSLDIETEGDQPFPKLVTLQMYSPDSDQYYFLNDIPMINTMDFSIYSVCGHYLNYDLRTLYQNIPTFKFPTVFFDTYIAGQMMQMDKLSLKDMVPMFLGYQMKHLDEVGFFKLGVEPTKEQHRYAFDDVFQQWKLTEYMLDHFIKTPQQRNIMQIECNIIPALCEIEALGVAVDRAGAKEFVDQQIDIVHQKEAEFTDRFGVELNVNSPKKVADFLFLDDMGPRLNPVIKTASGAPSTNEKALAYFNTPEVNAIKELKQLYANIKGSKTLVNSITHHATGEDIIYFEFKTIGYGEGSSRIYTKPSIQSLPKAYRGFMRPRPGYKFVYFDLISAELILLAYLSGCKKLTDMYEQGGDPHKFIGEMVKQLGYPIPEQFDDRSVSKVIAFATVYGSEGPAVSQALLMDKEVGYAIVRYFMSLFPEISSYQTAVHREYEQTYIASTCFGRQRLLKTDGDKANRQAFSTRIQGSLADYMKIFTAKMAPLCAKYNSRVCFEVFDSFLLEVPETLSSEVIRSEIIDPVISSSSKVKFRYKYGEGQSWLEADQNAC